jgi:hypothetical protein
MTELNRYARGKIYKIVSDSCDDIYIGSTCEPTLARRLAGHVGDYAKYLRGTYKYISSFQILERGDYSIVLIKEYPCENKAQLFSKERYYIDKYKDVCINKVKNVGLKLELGIKEYKRRYNIKYNEENSDIVKEHNKKYYAENSDKIKEKVKKYYQENTDKVKEYSINYRKQNIEKKRDYDKKRREENKDKIKAYMQQKMKCKTCGSIYMRNHKQRHRRTQKHQNALENVQ